MSTNSTRIPVVVQGVGALGRLVVAAVSNDPRIELVGAIDSDPRKSGRRLPDVTGFPSAADVPIHADLTDMLSAISSRPTLLIHMTESRPDRITDQLIDAMDAGLNVISAAESLFYPNLRYPAQSERLNTAARRNGVTITGGGINPGFVFDGLALDLAAATTGITHIALSRAVEIGDTGPGDIEHVGFGLSIPDFEAGVASGHIEGHMGLPESFTLLAEYLDLAIDRIAEQWEPVVADVVMPSTIGDIPAGNVVGIVQTGQAFDNDREVMSARLAMYYDATGFEAPHDEIVLSGVHNIRNRTEPAAVSLLGAGQVITNLIVPVNAAAPGLVCSLDLPAARTRRSNRVYRTDKVAPGDITVIADI